MLPIIKSKSRKCMLSVGRRRPERCICRWSWGIWMGLQAKAGSLETRETSQNEMVRGDDRHI